MDYTGINHPYLRSPVHEDVAYSVITGVVQIYTFNFLSRHDLTGSNLNLGPGQSRTQILLSLIRATMITWGSAWTVEELVY